MRDNENQNIRKIQKFKNNTNLTNKSISVSEKYSNIGHRNSFESPIMLFYRTKINFLKISSWSLIALVIWTIYSYSKIVSISLRETQAPSLEFEYGFHNFNVHSETNKHIDGASACLIIKDDNPRLIEWLAYHYQVLPLRNLIVTSDPSSSTSPTPILDRWRKEVPDMNIMEWTEEDYHYNKFQGEMVVNWIDDNMVRAVKLLINRQYAFYGHCAAHFKKSNATWVFIIDVDEYIVFNKIDTKSDPRKIDEVNDIMKLSQSSLTSEQRYGIMSGMEKDSKNIVYHARERERDSLSQDFFLREHEAMRLRRELPSSAHVTVLEYIDRTKDDPASPFHQNFCVIMPRLFFSAVESTSEDELLNDVPQVFNQKNFDTLTYFRHAQKGSFPWNTYGKSMIDVSKASYEDLVPVRAHKASPNCQQHNPFENVYYSEALLRVHHYLSSPEVHLSRKDDRRSSEKYFAGAKLDYGTSYEAQTWFKAFIDHVGVKKAFFLLNDVDSS